MNFPTEYHKVLERIDQIDPLAYGRSRNFVDGAVTYLSPYIARGVISTKQIMAHVLAKGYSPWKIEKFLQELAWRDHWQRNWLTIGEEIQRDPVEYQRTIRSQGVPSAVMHAETGIHAIDEAINKFYETGYVHNHVRMYLAAIVCNNGNYHWKPAAQWMYYHLLDADWASNAFSWRWVAGVDRKKIYLANQENVNKYCYSKQRGTFLDLSYEALAEAEVPEALAVPELPRLQTAFPEVPELKLNKGLPTAIYTFYNLDPKWRSAQEMNRVLLLEPSHFKTYPVASRTIDFVLQLTKNIPGLQVFVGEFGELKEQLSEKEMYFKEHPFNDHFTGVEDPRDWMFDIEGYHRSFFGFWKKGRKALKAV